ncbi:hypothetical protein SUGI_0773500 [Cryptomeria japonica]|uniref:non-specific lipid-transfer protein 1 n=1 Tax=Cryptomeria japonica TaxID=3369 RepID=UPI0024149005|nr:non-specific lipid-transfer protein 1 [Cryptomeria japonica]GLJ38006.1 hypothetical protein SUGI_0773500 [Cryptomeria japonica]
MRAVLGVTIAMALVISVFNSCHAQLTCPAIASALTPCLGYIVNGGQVPPKCCDGVRKVSDMAKTSTDKQTACQCIKTAATSIKPLPSSLTNLPKACAVNIGIPVSLTTDCSKVH